MGRQFPPAGGTGPIARRADGCGVPRPRISALRFPHLGVRRVRTDNLARQSAGMRRAATLPSAQHMHVNGGTRNNNAQIRKDNNGSAGSARLLRGACHRPAKGRTRWLAMTVEVVLERQRLSLRGARSATKQSPPRGWAWRAKRRLDGAKATSRFGRTNPSTTEIGFGKTNPRPRFGRTNPRCGRTVSMADGDQAKQIGSPGKSQRASQSAARQTLANVKLI
jgi:hypothetical protein